jgi:2-oxoglutarate dehydrogenase E2 component (dihydrolipoamide succinyltransferase)
MIIDIKIPSPGESITEVELASWFVENGSLVTRDQEMGEIESEKATLPLIAEKSGKVELLAEPGDTLKVGTVVCRIDTSVQPDTGTETNDEDQPKPETAVTGKEEAERPPETSGKNAAKEATKTAAEATTGAGKHTSTGATNAVEKTTGEQVKTTPLARKIMEEEGFSIDDVINGLRKITAADVRAVKETGFTASDQAFSRKTASREEERTKISQLRKKISERLVAVKNETAMLTTFNEADMSGVMTLRKKYQDKFVEIHGVKLGFMSFFTRAVTMALQQYPSVNSYLDGDEIVSPDFCDVGIAVQTDKGLMVPVIRNTETLGLAEIEKMVLDIAGRARKNRITMDELTGGTFTITNGGIFGSMLSTPILNPPQSAILGMHNILERPVAVNGKVEIRPMMYLALSYDHRVIDGKDSVGFLKAVKTYIENPASMLFGDQNPEEILLGL